MDVSFRLGQAGHLKAQRFLLLCLVIPASCTLFVRTSLFFSFMNSNTVATEVNGDLSGYCKMV